MAHKTYSPKDVQISYSGIAVAGFGEDDFVSLERTSPLMTPTTGADGILTRTKVADRTGTITITLAQTAKANSTLAAISRTQELAKDLAVGNIIISDPSGSVLAVGINSVLAALPSVSLGSEATNGKEWQFHCEILDYDAIPADILADLPDFTIIDGKLVS